MNTNSYCIHDRKIWREADVVGVGERENSESLILIPEAIVGKLVDNAW